MNDTTFPIWFLSMNELPMLPTSCYTDRYLPRTTNHPCNDVLRDLFYNTNNSNIFPDRVHFLDNTDLTGPIFEKKYNPLDSNFTSTVIDNDIVLANIAIRIYVLVGKGVADWRAIGQHGLIDGLHKDFDKIIEPNFELIPYTGWNETI